MEAAGQNQKRKKRKTRKCLDELRKKSRPIESSCDSNSENTVPLVIKRDEKKKVANNNINVTKSRLTLKHGMFAKGIRSETVTRSNLTEESKARRDGDLYKIIDLANGGPSHTITSGAYERSKQENSSKETKSTSAKFRLKDPTKYELNTSNKNLNETENVSHMLNPARGEETRVRESSSDKNPKELNAVKHQLSPPFTEESSEVSDEDNISSETIESEDCSAVYTVFVNNLPRFLTESVPKLTKSKIFDKTKQFLRTVYTESYETNSQDCDNISNESNSEETLIQTTEKENVVLNPIEYLKRSCDPKLCVYPSTSYNFENIEDTKKCKKVASCRPDDQSVVRNHNYNPVKRDEPDKRKPELQLKTQSNNINDYLRQNERKKNQILHSYKHKNETQSYINGNHIFDEQTHSKYQINNINFERYENQNNYKQLTRKPINEIHRSYLNVPNDRSRTFFPFDPQKKDESTCLEYNKIPKRRISHSPIHEDLKRQRSSPIYEIILLSSSSQSTQNSEELGILDKSPDYKYYYRR